MKAELKRSMSLSHADPGMARSTEQSGRGQGRGRGRG